MSNPELAAHLLEFYTKHAEKCQNRIDKLKLKEQTKNVIQNTKGWQNSLDCYMDTIQILEAYLSQSK